MNRNTTDNKLEEMDKDPETQADRDLGHTENNSLTYATTKSAVLDFHFGVMQNTPKETVFELLEASWKENSAITLKLIFQLRDIRHGKGAMIEFHHCLTWLFSNHPKTLISNLEFISQHGYWKDLLWLIKFLLEDRVAINTAKPTKVRVKAECSDASDEDFKTLVRRRVNGEVSRQTWQRYLRSLQNDEARKNARDEFQKISKEVHLERSQNAKEKRKQAKVNYSHKLAERCNQNENFRLLYDRVVDLFVNALLKGKGTVDHLTKTEAIAAKWVPTIGGSIDNATSLGKAIARKLYCATFGKEAVESAVDEDEVNRRAFAFYRKEFVTPLRKNIQVPESYMSANKWEEIDYQRVPSKCMKRNKKHFLERDSERFKMFLSQVEDGKKKIASGALLPHEIVNIFMSDAREEPDLERVTELQWKDYVNDLKKSGTLKSALSVCDVSGSMSGVPMQVAIALSILTSEVSEPPFHGRICTFSDKPILQVLNQGTLKEKVDFARSMDWGTNTNFQAVFDLILKLAKDTKMESSDMVKTIFVFSDMEFDEACGHPYETDYQIIKRKFTEAGYPIPSIVFWNLRGDHSKPVTRNEENVALVSGFSGQMMKFFLEHGEFSNPYTAMIEALGNRYDHLKVVD